MTTGYQSGAAGAMPIPPPRLSSQPVTARDTAYAAVALGISVVPPKTDGTKAPIGQWKQYQSELPTNDTIQKWYGHYAKPKRDAVGFVCGAVSGNLETFEFDAEGESYEPFRATAAALGIGSIVDRIEDGYVERSPSGGIHWFYRCEVIGGNTELARYESENEVDERTGRPKIRPLIETRGEGGYIIASPSCGDVHPTGKPYVLVRGGLDTIAWITPAEREALWNLARTFDRMPARDQTELVPAKVKIAVSSDWSDCLTPWDDFNARTAWEEVLPPGWVSVYRQGEVTYWRRPGKQKGVSATTGRNGSDRFYSFSSSTEFPVQKALSRFDAYAVLRHAGDFKAAVVDLAAKGFGQYKTWIKVDGEWVLETRQNPCPKGVRIAKQGDKPPREPTQPSTPVTVAASMPATIQAPLSNGKPVEPEYGFGQLSDKDLGLAKLSSYQSRPIPWFWPYRLTKGGLSMMAGDGGIGKSQLLLYIACLASRGGLFPDGSGSAPLCDVVLVCAEDRPEDTVRPRVEAMGGDLERIMIVKAKYTIHKEGRPPTVSPASFQEKDYWHEVFNRLPNCSLFIVDPLPSFLGRGVNDSKNIEIRAILEPFLDEVIAPRDICMIGNTHLNKSVDAKTPMHRISGSIAYGTLPRNVHFVVRDPDSPDRRFFKQAKCNNAPDDLPAIAFRVERREVLSADGEVIETAVPVFEAETVAVNLTEVVAGNSPGKRGPDPKKENEVAEWIYDYLADRTGWTDLREIRSAAGAAGLIGKQDDKGKWNNLTRLYRGRDRVPSLPEPRAGKRVADEDMAEPRDRYPKIHWRLADPDGAF